MTATPGERLDHLSPRQRALLEQRLERRLRERQADRPWDHITPRPGSMVEIPLSFAQQRLWFIDQLEPGSPLYNMPVALHVEGPLAPGVLALCLGEIARRHETLRTVFTEVEGSPVQVIRAAAPFAMSMVDLSGLPESRREALALALAGEEAARPFNLTCGPLLRGVLLRLGEGDHIAALTMHHIASDGWSMGILVREVTALYAAFVEGRPSPLPELPVQYADFAVWQRAWLQGENLEREISFWRRQLAGLPPRLELPTDRPRPAVQSFRGASRPMWLPAELIRQAQDLSRREGATLFIVLLAGFQALLARYSGQQDLAVGTPDAGRNRVEIEDLIGFFVNTLVLRGDLTGDPERTLSFRELLRRSRETVLAAHKHQDVPFEKLVEELTPKRSLAQSPLFQVMLVLQNTPVERLEIQSLRLSPVGGAGTMAKFDLMLAFKEWNGGLSGAVEHATELFDAATIHRLAIHYERLLTAALARPESPALELPLLGEAERQQTLVEWNDTSRKIPEGALIYGPISGMAERSPCSVAVVWEGGEMTYGALERRSNRLARRLYRLGVGPEVPVGLCIDRSGDLVVAILGILKAGGAYVPLDPEYPRERLEFMLADCGAPVLVAQERTAGLAAAPGARTVQLDEQGPDTAPEDHRPMVPAALPENLAYVIYTSGSTGRPKGVAVTHRSAVELVRWARAVYAPEELAGVLAATSLSFDLSVFELFVPLSSGGTVILAQNVLDLPALSSSGRVTLVNTVPSAISALVHTGSLGASVRTVNLAGEPLQRSLAEQIYATGTVERVWNLYGPSEDTTYSTCSRVARESSTAPSIGRPITATRAYVLTAGLEPVPVGVAGELHLGGAGLARGYLHRPDLTAERFIPDPFATERSSRMYRTGDLVRWTVTGELEFLGRLDHQVKIRGFRIEPDEIEKVLLALAGVREAVVVPREDRSEMGPGDRRLVAYVAGDVSMEALRQSLRERLPDYMVPAAFVPLAALPLTPNGKVDRRALPAPEWRHPVEGHVAPRTPVEEVLAGIWAGLLGTEQIGATDHFFDRGGHSLLATRVMSRLRSAFGVEMPLRELFEAPILADLAARVEAALPTGTRRLAPPLLPVPRQAPLPLSFAQQRLWFIDQLEPGSPLYNMHAALRVGGPLDARVLALCFGEIVRRHETLRTIFERADGAPVQMIQPAAPFGLPVVDLSGLLESEREAAALALAGEEAARPFDLARGPLLRAALLRLAEGDHVVALTMHHIVSDGWSIGILIREVAALYTAFAEGRPSPLPELPVQYADFAAWQRSWLHGEALESEISFWRQQLAGLPPRLELPADRPRPAVQSFRGATRPVHLPAELIRQLQALSRREGATLFMVLLAGFQALLARYSGQEDLAVGTPVAGRNRVEIEDLIGFFVNALVLRGDLAGAPSFQELLGRVRETALAAHAHQDVPFERLVQELSPERSLGQTPLFQVMLALQNAPVESLEIQNLHLRPVSGAGTTAKFDLTFGFQEQNGGLSGSVELATDLFDVATIDRLIGHFERLLASAAASPSSAVSALPLLNQTELTQILREWNDTRVEGLAEGCLHHDVAAQAARRPTAVAVELGGERWTYRRLVGSARRLARHLRKLDVGPDVIVGLCAERSPIMVVGILAVLEAGGAYLPLDPAYPGERLAFMLDDSGARVLLIQEHLLERVPTAGRSVVPLDARWDSGQEMSEPLRVAMTPDHLAYVIYTSGSTGRPKGVMVPHRGVCNRLRWAQQVYRLDEHDAVLQKASLGFDISVWECFAPLAAGARLVLAESGRQGEGPYLVRVLREHRVTLVDFSPSMLAVFLGEEDAETCVSLRQIFVGGEALTPELRDRALARLSVPLDNQYGPTEISIDTTRWACTPGQESYRVRIGRPIANSRLYAVDPELQPAPVGVAGELLVGGAGLTRGYLGRPDLTAERFVPDPFSGDSGGRLYRTGDLVRWLPDGSLDFLGRVDRQVKIRGFRIELGEIEAALSSLAGISQAVVVVREDTPGDPRLVAYVAGDLTVGALRQSLRERLPDFMVPAAIVTLAALPLTPNGKVDRNALPAPEWQRPEDYQALQTPLEAALARIWAELLGLEQVGATDQFFELGGHSLLLVRVQARVAKELGREVSLVDLFRYPTVRALAGFLEPDADALSPSPRNRAPSPQTRRIAIIGMAGRFPGASGVEAFWQNLCAGVESISFHPDADLEAAGVAPSLRSSPHFVPAGGVLEGIELFDAGFFGYTPRDAETTDPQHRLFLECAWEALEASGYVPEGCPGPVGVFAGVGRSDYLRNLISNPEIFRSLGAYRIGVATDKDFLTTNVSYKLDLKGPSMSIQTACSTSLVAVHVACRSLLTGECDMALAGGASVAVPQRTGYLYQEGDISSPDGHCRAFDARAQGTVSGSGVGVVVLKRLEDALADGDPIRAVILGSAINNDGSGKVGYMAPSVDGQAEVIRAALEAGGIDPRTVGYVEAHGTGTPLGDPIEIAALTQAFRAAGAGERGFCAVGSVKTNVGHLDTAAGVAGLIKAALAVESGLIPPSLHFESPNPAIDFAASPFRINDRLQAWRPDGLPRRAGVSSFGIGGTNAHAVLEEAPPAEPSGPSRRHELLLLSARTPAALEAATRNLAEFLAAHPDASLPDVAWTLQVGRRAFEHRRMLVCEGLADAVAHLREPSGSERVFTRRQEPGRRAVAFLFPGQGAQYPDMGRDLYETEPVFRTELDACAERLLSILGRDLREILFPAAERSEEAARELRQTRFAQPALFAVELALARLWISWGIRPVAMIGHSLGEYVAACLASVFSPEDALELVAARGVLMQELPPGAMLSVELSEGELALELGAVPEASLAAVNASSRCVVSGPEAAVAFLEARLVSKGVQVRRLRTSHAFHSAMMDPILAAFAQRVAQISRKPPAIPFISNLTGTWITAAQATDPGYWVRHLRETVRFAEGTATLLAGSRAALLEVGPGGTLADLIRRQPRPAARPDPICSLPRAGATEPGSAALLGALGRLWLSGVEVDWRSVHAGERRRRVPLPAYPFERQRFWIEASPHGFGRMSVADRRRFTILGGDPDEPLARALQAGGHEVERARSAADLAGLFMDSRSAEALERLLALEPGIRVVLPQAILPQAPKAVSAPEAGAPAVPAEPIAGYQRPDLSVPWQAPANDLERRITAIWEELLGIQGIGVRDDFFELGGDSLLATRLRSRLREELGREIPLETIFTAPTVARCAAHLTTAGEPQTPRTSRIQRAQREMDLPLSFAQQHIWVIQQLDPDDPAYSLPGAFRLRGVLDPAAVAWSLRNVVARHEVLRTTYPVVQGWPVQRIAMETGMPLPTIDLGLLDETRAGKEMHALLMQAALRPFDLARGPVFRAMLIRLTAEDHVLWSSFHHICFDGWSWGVLFSELAALYTARRAGRPSPLPPLPLQYADFAVWQRDRTGEIEGQLDWWRERLAGRAPLQLAPDRLLARGEHKGAVESFQVALDLTESLRALGQAEGCTLFMVLLTLFKVLLHQRTGREDVSVGSPVAGRISTEVEGLIGNFVNTLVLRTDLGGDPPFRELLARVRKSTLEAHSRQETPFEQVAAALYDRTSHRVRLFEVWFVLHNMPAPSLELSGLTAAPVPVDGLAPRHDLSFSLWPTPRGLHAALEYRTDLFAPSFVRQMAEDFTSLAQAVMVDAGLRRSALTGLLGRAQQERREARKQVAKVAGLERLREKRRKAV